MDTSISCAVVHSKRSQNEQQSEEILRKKKNSAEGSLSSDPQIPVADVPQHGGGHASIKEFLRTGSDRLSRQIPCTSSFCMPRNSKRTRTQAHRALCTHERGGTRVVDHVGLPLEHAEHLVEVSHALNHRALTDFARSYCSLAS